MFGSRVYLDTRATHLLLQNSLNIPATITSTHRSCILRKQKLFLVFSGCIQASCTFHTSHITHQIIYIVVQQRPCSDKLTTMCKPSSYRLASNTFTAQPAVNQIRNITLECPSLSLSLALFICLEFKLDAFGRWLYID